MHRWGRPLLSASLGPHRNAPTMRPLWEIFLQRMRGAGEETPGDLLGSGRVTRPRGKPVSYKDMHRPKRLCRDSEVQSRVSFMDTAATFSPWHTLPFVS